MVLQLSSPPSCPSARRTPTHLLSSATLPSSQGNASRPHSTAHTQRTAQRPRAATCCGIYLPSTLNKAASRTTIQVPLIVLYSHNTHPQAPPPPLTMEVDDETSTHSDAEIMKVEGHNDDSDDASVYSSASDVQILTVAAAGGTTTTTAAAAAVAAGAAAAGAAAAVAAAAGGAAAAAAGPAVAAPAQVDESEGSQVRPLFLSRGWIARYFDLLTPPSLLRFLLNIQVSEEQTEVFSSYKPTITIGQPHPSPVIESGLLSSVPLPPLAYDALALPPDAISQGKLSSLQFESILYAGQRHRLVQHGVRAGFFSGDSTGTGKGRQIAGMILDNIARGRRKHMWVSTSNDLKEETIRDFADIGASGVLVKDMSELDAAVGPLGMSKEFVNASSGLVIFTTYILIIGQTRLGKSSEVKTDPSTKVKTDPSTKVARVDQLIEFFGGDAFDGIIAFDECHKARGSHVNPEQSSKASQAALELQRRLPLARIVYASATGVDLLEQMGFAERLLLWGGGSPSFKNFEAFTAKFLKKGGNLGLLELLAIELKLSGCYVARGK